jgi:hypothetical protein
MEKLWQLHATRLTKMVKSTKGYHRLSSLANLNRWLHMLFFSSKITRTTDTTTLHIPCIYVSADLWLLRKFFNGNQTFRCLNRLNCKVTLNWKEKNFNHFKLVGRVIYLTLKNLHTRVDKRWLGRIRARVTRIFSFDNLVRPSSSTTIYISPYRYCCLIRSHYRRWTSCRVPPTLPSAIYRTLALGKVAHIA